MGTHCSLFNYSSDSSLVSAYQTTEELLVELAGSRGLVLRKFDINQDNTVDIYKMFKISHHEDGTVLGEYLVRTDTDINHDGKIDVTRIFDDEEQLSEETIDLDFDGTIDTRSFYVNGKISKKEVDINYDGIPDLIQKYEGGKLRVIESDQSGDGQVDTWEYFEKDVLDRIGKDIDADGKVDIWERVAPALEEEEDDGESDSPPTEE